MKAILINGSSNEGGNTYQMLADLRTHLGGRGVETELAWACDLLAELDTPHCTACSDSCEGSCYAGTRLEAFFSRMARADIIVAASPVYFGTVSAPLKTFYVKCHLENRSEVVS